jgi:hypothetical protein
MHKAKSLPDDLLMCAFNLSHLRVTGSKEVGITFSPKKQNDDDDMTIEQTVQY